jgi:DNA-binding Lrp family transcriptional regulator
MPRRSRGRVAKSAPSRTGSLIGAARVVHVRRGASVDAFFLVQAERGKAVSVLERVRSLEGVIDAQMVTGPYDVIARVRLADLREVDILLMVRVKTLDGVLRALPCPVVPRQRAVW